ncbi:MAG: hypothetical protein KIS86_10730 [Devosia sp.]|nr:hypothetical protein [Devosia sp.]
MKKVRIAIDMDEVIADALPAMLDWAKAKFNLEWAPEARNGKDMDDLLNPEQFRALHAHIHGGKFFSDLAVVEGAQDAVRELSESNDVFITTAAMEFPRSFAYKWTWLETHFPYINPMNVVFCGNKSIVNADFLIDDRARHFENFVGQGILFDAPHNADVDGYPRLKGWKDARQLIERLSYSL